MRSFKLRHFGLTASLILIALVASGCFQTAGAALEATNTPVGGAVIVPPTPEPPTATLPLPTAIAFEPTQTPIAFPSETPTNLFPTETPVTVAFGVTNTPEPTFTPQFTFTPLPDQPTYTPYPTYTPPPTYTALPTAAPAIVIPGATKIGLLPRAQDATQTQQAVFAEATQIVLNSQMTQTASSMQFQTTVATLQQTQPPPPGSGSTPVPPTGQFIPVYITATPAGTPGIPGSHAAGFFDGATCRYFVIGDDTLYSIALRLKIRVTTLAAANGIVNVELIRPGQYLKVPQPYCNQAAGIVPTQIIVVGAETPRPPGVIPTLGSGGKTYVVREGDTLFGIAARFRVSATALAQANNIANISLIYMGQILVIP